MEEIKLNKENFEKIAPELKPWLKDHCNYCGEKITKKTFGFLSKNITCCKSELCLFLAMDDKEEIEKLKTKNI